MLDLNSNSNSKSESDPICYDYHKPLPSPGTHLKDTHDCPGFEVTVPEGWSPFMEWPWLEYEGMAMSTSILIENGKLTIHSATCMGNGDPCQECQKSRLRLPLACIQGQITQGIPKSTPYQYLSMWQMVDLLRWKDHQINDLKLASLNHLHRLDTLTTSNMDYKQFTMAASQCDAPHINVLVQSVLQKKHGIGQIIQLLTRASLGTLRSSA